MAIKVLILGSTGMLGKAYASTLRHLNFEVIGISRKNSDLNLDLSKLTTFQKALSGIQPDIIVNCAAVIDFQLCETRPEYTSLINTGLVKILAEWSITSKKPLIHVSTDHFFLGRDKFANTETQEVFLANEYAKQKFMAERHALRSKSSLVLRTSIVGRRNWGPTTLAEWAIDVVQRDLKANLYDDAWTSSIDTITLVQTSLDLLLKKSYFGLINVGSTEIYSKAEFVEEIARQKNIKLKNSNRCSIHMDKKSALSSLGLSVKKVESITNQKMPTLNQVVQNVLREVC